MVQWVLLLPRPCHILTYILVDHLAHEALQAGPPLTKNWPTTAWAPLLYIQYCYIVLIINALNDEKNTTWKLSVPDPYIKTISRLISNYQSPQLALEQSWNNVVPCGAQGTRVQSTRLSLKMMATNNRKRKGKSSYEKRREKKQRDLNESCMAQGLRCKDVKRFSSNGNFPGDRQQMEVANITRILKATSPKEIINASREFVCDVFGEPKLRE